MIDLEEFGDMPVSLFNLREIDCEWCFGPSFERNRKLGITSHTRETVTIGALSFSNVIKIKGRLPVPLAVAEIMFSTPMDGKEMQGYKDRFKSLELGHLLDPGDLGRLHAAEPGAAAAAALGVDQADVTSKDPLEVEAWFLSNLAWYLFQLKDREVETEVERRELQIRQINCAIALGRLVEWWRWYNEGHDSAAIRGKLFMRKTPEQAIDQRQRDHDRRRRALIDQARICLANDQGRFANGNINFSALADACLRQTKDSLNIGKAWAGRLLKEAEDCGELEFTSTSVSK